MSKEKQASFRGPVGAGMTRHDSALESLHSGMARSSRASCGCGDDKGEAESASAKAADLEQTAPTILDTDGAAEQVAEPAAAAAAAP